MENKKENIDKPNPWDGLVPTQAKTYEPCLWDNVKPGTPMWMICNCPKCSVR